MTRTKINRIEIVVSVSEYADIVRNASEHSFSNISKWLRRAGVEYDPEKQKRYERWEQAHRNIVRRRGRPGLQDFEAVSRELEDADNGKLRTSEADDN